MVEEEWEAFAVDDQDIGLLNEEMKIDLVDEIPVQRRYNTIPKPLYPEIKAYIEDMLARKFIATSRSNYSAAMVVARKPNGELRLCCDYRGINKKTLKDKFPLIRIQENLDMLGGNSWFTVLDQGKAYHQIPLEEGSKKYTTLWVFLNGSVYPLD